MSCLEEKQKMCHVSRALQPQLIMKVQLRIQTYYSSRAEQNQLLFLLLVVIPAKMSWIKLKACSYSKNRETSFFSSVDKNENRVCVGLVISYLLHSMALHLSCQFTNFLTSSAICPSIQPCRSFGNIPLPASPHYLCRLSFLTCKQKFSDIT